MESGIAFNVGQIVHWPPAPGQLAQVIELRRRCVGLFYLTRSGRQRRPIVAAVQLQRVQDPHRPLLPLHNPFSRAILKPAGKTFGGSHVR